uniref:Uncharacterized protein n=1 Tax=Ananas comosus var. bracteatus TaxID=296719 RepID=A0A6V7QMM7_ANACO|nr:unnamed protein product [Ananas comosus var. bracteatus]
MPWGRLIPRIRMLTTTGPLGTAQVGLPTAYGASGQAPGGLPLGPGRDRLLPTSLHSEVHIMLPHGIGRQSGLPWEKLIPRKRNVDYYGTIRYSTSRDYSLCNSLNDWIKVRCREFDNFEWRLANCERLELAYSNLILVEFKTGFHIRELGDQRNLR